MNYHKLFELKTMHDTIFSPNRIYRYQLKTKVSYDKGTCMFLMLNPSIADEVTSDPTINRVKKYLKTWGYGNLIVCNIFALRSTDPKGLRDVEDPIGEDNDRYILQSAKESDMIICAWGNHGLYLDRGAQVMKMLKENGMSDKLHCLDISKVNQPKHPLYLKANMLPISFRGEENE